MPSVASHSRGAIFNDLEWVSKIFNDKKHRAASLRQLSFLFWIKDEMRCVCQVWAEVDSVSLRGTQEQSRGRRVDDAVGNERQRQQSQQPHQRRRRLRCRLASAVTPVERSVVSRHSLYCRSLSPLKPTSSVLQLLRLTALRRRFDDPPVGNFSATCTNCGSSVSAVSATSHLNAALVLTTYKIPTTH